MRIQLEIFAVSPAQTGDAFVVVLKEAQGERTLPIIIGSAEAHAIALRINGIRPERPLTHDLIENMLNDLGVGVNYVCIREVNDGVFKADIAVQKVMGEQVMVDARTSDALAVAVRMDCQIYIESEVFDDASDTPVPAETKAAASGIEMPVEGAPVNVKQLKKDLDSALENENYEEAAKIRDLISAQQ